MKKTYTIGINAELNVLRELSLVSIVIIFSKLTHVFSYMKTKDVFTVDLSIKLLALSIKAREPFCAVGNVQATINCSFHSPEDSGTGACTHETYIQVAPESIGSIVIRLNTVSFTINFKVSRIKLVQSELLQELENVNDKIWKLLTHQKKKKLKYAEQLVILPFWRATAQCSRQRRSLRGRP